ncbi:hypothetical protein HYPSUDRAFT_67736 [Hypholoma sublateritium FD-334 SS-4]|uniref:F-box domain-containing protein n=1 Tax=Hypholoma sublateritium (strain FD-334 SS-4) TaxID=945553 RepID=A0A0D2NY25_HYPSF|nr:hypothetical protein HYPSUDRAFT_67736 [Hypholoma sublateritium FD-334 SS-4]
MAPPRPLMNHSSTPLSNKEITSFQRRVADINNALQIIRLETADSGIATVQVEKLLRMRRHAYVTSLSLVRRIPPEVWERIFLLIPEEFIVVSRVCRFWRRVAVSIPSLWPNDLLVYLTPHEKDSHRPMISRFLRTPHEPAMSACILSRKNAPLPSNIKIILNLRDVAWRVPLKRLFVVPEFVRQLFGADYVHKKYWGSLKELVIDRSESQGGSIASLRETDPITLTHLSALTHLTINLKNRITRLSIQAPWNQLEYLHLDGGYSDAIDCVWIVVSCPQLRTLILACRRTIQRRSRSTKRVILHSLRTLILMGGDDITAMLSHFQMPVLKFLRLAAQVFSRSKAHNRYQDSAEDITHFVKASACTLIQLELHSVALVDFEIPNCFRAMPGLDFLRLVDDGGMPDVLECLRTAHRESHAEDMPVHLLPKLRALLVDTAVPEHWPRELFNAMCHLRSTIYIRGCEGSRLVTASLTHRTEPFRVNSELSSFVRSLAPFEGINLQLPYVKATRKAGARK